MLAVMLVVTACGGSGDSSGDPTATVPPTPALALEIGTLVWATGVDATSGAPLDQLDALPNSADRVVAVLAVPSLPAGTTLQARWTVDGDPMPGLDPAPIVIDEPMEDAWVSWQLEWTADEPWPIGTLGITVEVDGNPVISEQLPIVRSTG